MLTALGRVKEIGAFFCLRSWSRFLLVSAALSETFSFVVILFFVVVVVLLGKC